MDWTTAVSVAARLGYQSYNHRQTIQKYWTKAKAYVDVGDTQIVITGHAGAGKTMLAGQMHGRARELVFEIPGESRSVEVDAITAGQWTKLVRVLPGHTGFRTHGEIETFEDNRSLEGVIHVVDFGYVAPRDPVARDTLVSKYGIDTVEKLRARNLRLEVEDLKVLLSDIRRLHSKHENPSWLAIAVNKVDLFAADRQKALNHYHPDGTGEFGGTLREFQGQIGSSNFAVHVIQACAYETDFSWHGSNVPSSLQRREQDEILRQFMESIAAISEARK